MKICLISKQFYPKTIGGAEVYMYEIYKRIKKGNNITILTYDDVDYEEAEVIFVPKLHFTISSFLFSIIAGLKAKFGDYDIVHINGYWAEFSGLFVSNNIVTIHDVGFLENKRKGVLNKIRFFILGEVMKSAKKVITVSEKTKVEILRHFKFKINEDKIEVIPNGIDLEKYLVGSGEEIRKRYGITEKKIIFSFGRFARNKGYEYLMDAFKEVNQKLKNSYLIIVGRTEDRKYREELEKRAEGINNILLLQNVTEDEKLSLFAACDIFCQPSITEEGFGIALLEAMASGKAFVATKIFSGIEHIPKEFLVEERNAKELADRIIELLNSDYKEIGMKMRRKVEKYSWDNTVDEILKLYRKVNKND